MENAQDAIRGEPAAEGSAVGREFYRGKKIPAGVLDGREIGCWKNALKNPARSKLALLHSGNAVLSVCGRETTIIAPAAVFVPHEADVALDLAAADRNDKLILFHPQFVFETLTLDFDFSDARDPGTCNDGFMLYRFSPEREPAERSLFLEPGVYRFLGESAERMGDELEKQPDWSWPCRARSYLLEILIACTKLKESPTGLFAAEGTPAADAEVEGLYGYLIARLGESLSVDAIARAFGTNRTSLQTRVRRATGLSVAQYVISLRVQTASVLLRNTSLPIAEIMDRTGFADESHFSRSFRRYTGRTPSDFRKAFIVPSYVR
ncbi:MAG TPA: AraC family transcriptional regulator [Treponemataceae bacterium]|nr:AraC family transcriptional regulator [Treponemataceae bacterium]